MLRKVLLALACLAAIGLPVAANAATIFGFGFLIDFGNGDGAVGQGRLFATDNGDDSFTITGARGNAAYVTFPSGDLYAEATIRDAGASFFAPDGTVPTITFANGIYSFDNLALSGDGRFYDFSHDGDGNLVGVSGEVGGPAQFQFGILDAVPEPATWGMMLVGFGASGAMLRRRRSVRRAA